MDVYHIWCNLKSGVSDVDFAVDVKAYFDQLRDGGKIHGYRITRCKLGLRPAHLREFHITVDVEDLGQLQNAFNEVSSRTDPVETLHQVVNSKVEDTFFALYRDFPDQNRVVGQEKF